jgi:hypothetical protein
MSTDDAPWPYKALDRGRQVPKPTWDCPEGICVCDSHAEATYFEYSVLLCDPGGARMPGARCRALLNGYPVNDNPYADAQGWITVVVRRTPESLLLEWAPASMPVEPPYPYRMMHYVDLSPNDPEECASRRLANLGFSTGRSLRDSVAGFQRRYDYTVITSNWQDIDPELRAYHDNGCLPVVAQDTDPSAPLPAPDPTGVALGRPQPRRPPSPPPAPPGPRGNSKTGGGKPPGQGTARFPTSPKPNCHFSFVMHTGPHHRPLAGAPFRLLLRQGKTYSGVTGANGTLDYGDVPAGDYALEIAGGRMWVPALNKSEHHRPLLLRRDGEQRS